MLQNLICLGESYIFQLCTFTYYRWGYSFYWWIMWKVCFVLFEEEKEKGNIHPFDRRNRYLHRHELKFFLQAGARRVLTSIPAYLDWPDLALILSESCRAVIIVFWIYVIMYICLTEFLKKYFNLLHHRENIYKNLFFLFVDLQNFAFILFKFSFISNCVLFLILLFQKNIIHLI